MCPVAHVNGVDIKGFPIDQKFLLSSGINSHMS